MIENSPSYVSAGIRGKAGATETAVDGPACGSTPHTSSVLKPYAPGPQSVVYRLLE